MTLSRTTVVGVATMIFLTVINLYCLNKYIANLRARLLQKSQDDLHLPASDQQQHQQNLDSKFSEILKKLEDGEANLKKLEERLEGTRSPDEELFNEMIELSKKQVDIRKATLKSIKSADEFANLYGSLAPEVICTEKVRVGTIGDGGKWTCNPWKVPDDTVMLSFGLNNFIGFEIEWQKMLNNRNIIYGFDSADQNSTTKLQLSKIRGQSKKALISAQSAPEIDRYTMSELAKELNVTNVEILKIDIEGAENTCLIPFLEQFEVCQIYLETHGGADEHARLLDKIAHLNYRLFSYEVNGYAMNACEYSFIHEKCIDKYAGHRIANYLQFSK